MNINSLKNTIIPPLMYSAIIRLLLAYLIFKYVNINIFFKSLLLIILDAYDVAHFFQIFYAINGIPISLKEQQAIIIIDKWVDFFTYLIFYKVAFEPIANPYMNRIVQFFFYYRLFGVLLLTIYKCKKPLVFFPDFINSSFIVFGFYLSYPKIGLLWLLILFIIAIFIKIGIEIRLSKFTVTKCTL